MASQFFNCLSWQTKHLNSGEELFFPTIFFGIAFQSLYAFTFFFKKTVAEKIIIAAIPTPTTTIVLKLFSEVSVVFVIDSFASEIQIQLFSCRITQNSYCFKN